MVYFIEAAVRVSTRRRTARNMMAASASTIVKNFKDDVIILMTLLFIGLAAGSWVILDIAPALESPNRKRCLRL
jgi:hypothetical protein